MQQRCQRPKHRWQKQAGDAAALLLEALLDLLAVLAALVPETTHFRLASGAGVVLPEPPLPRQLPALSRRSSRCLAVSGPMLSRRSQQIACVEVVPAYLMAENWQQPVCSSGFASEGREGPVRQSSVDAEVLAATNSAPVL